MYLTSTVGRGGIKYLTPREGTKFLPRAPKAQGEEILVPSHGVRCFIPPRPTVEVGHSCTVTLGLFYSLPNDVKVLLLKYVRFT